MLKDEGEEAFAGFSYSILETCDIDMSADRVIAMETKWKNRLLTRAYGYNEN